MAKNYRLTTGEDEHGVLQTVVEYKNCSICGDKIKRNGYTDHSKGIGWIACGWCAEGVVCQRYTPVKHQDGQTYLQVTNRNWEFCGFVGFNGKWDKMGSFKVADQWLEINDEDFERIKQSMLDSGFAVTVIEDGDKFSKLLMVRY